MRMTNKKKLLGALAVAGIVAASGSAFTGTGLSTTGTAASAQFVGGTITQSVSGATLDSIAYTFRDTTNTAVKSVALTFADAAGGRTPTIAFAGGNTAAFTCSVIDGAFLSTCSPTTVDAIGITGIAVTVPTAP